MEVLFPRHFSFWPFQFSPRSLSDWWSLGFFIELGNQPQNQFPRCSNIKVSTSQHSTVVFSYDFPFYYWKNSCDKLNLWKYKIRSKYVQHFWAMKSKAWVLGEPARNEVTFQGGILSVARMYPLNGKNPLSSFWRVPNTSVGIFKVFYTFNINIA